MRPPSIPATVLALLAIAATARAEAVGDRIVRVEITGRTTEPEETLERFLGLVPGAHLDAALKGRVVDALKALGYLVPRPCFEAPDPKAPDLLQPVPCSEPTPGGLLVKLTIEPARVVRHVNVRGNWPVFDDDIRRRISLRAGSRLPPEAETAALLRKEAGQVKEFLRRDGYFDCDVGVAVKPGARPDWVNLDVQVRLGRWARVGDVIPDYTEPDLPQIVPCDPDDDRCPDGFACRPWEGTPQCRRVRALSPRDLRGQFTPSGFSISWFGRFRLDKMRDDARSAEELARDRGYPAARVIPQYEINPRTARAIIRPRVTQKASIGIRFVGNHAIPDADLRAKMTVFSAGAYDDVELRESASELHRLYQSKGFLEASVSCRRQRPEAPDPTRPGPDRTGDRAERREQRRERTRDYDIVCLIDEGPELKVRLVDLGPPPGGAPLHVPEADLRALLATKVFPRIGALGLGEGGYVTTLQLAQDAEKIAAHYRGLGWPEVRVRGEIARDQGAFGQVGVLAADVAARTGENDDLYVRFTIDEGEHEAVESIAFRFLGPHDREAPELAEAMQLSAGASFSSAALAADLKRVTTLYATQGHPYVVVDAREYDPCRPEDAGSTWNCAVQQCNRNNPAYPVAEGCDLPGDHTRVALLVKITEGPEVRFGPILIRGNFKTADSVIRADLPFQTGDLFDVTQLAVAERNLQHHAIFNGVQVKPVGFAGGSVNPVPILVEVQERYDDWGTPLLTAGYATDIGFAESLGYFWGNVFGGGGSFELRLEAAEDFARVTDAGFHGGFWRLLSASVRYAQPHLGVPPLRAEISGVARKESTIRLGEVNSAGGSLLFTWVPSPSFRLFARYDFTYSSLRNVDLQRLPGKNDALSAVPDNTTTGKLTFGAVWDDRVSFDGSKNPLLPARGWLLASTFAVAAKDILGFGLDTSHSFLVLSGQVQRFQPLGREVTLIANLRGDWGLPILGETALPAVERFFAGGDNTTRGFDTDKLKTEIIRGDVSPAPATSLSPIADPVGYRIIPQGGNIRFLATLELQFPIARIGPYPWVGALFVDAGTIFDNPGLFKKQDLKLSVGVTLLRILTPVGAVSLEYAYPVTQSLAEEQWKKESWYGHWPGRIHFNWGIPILR
ncbi:MAG: hypothetical protein EXR72_21745 [Myxococcales bacterium]|nr:hypothetical protein [Myxococcales bacterium]